MEKKPKQNRWWLRLNKDSAGTSLQGVIAAATKKEKTRGAEYARHSDGPREGFGFGGKVKAKSPAPPILTRAQSNTIAAPFHRLQGAVNSCVTASPRQPAAAAEWCASVERSGLRGKTESNGLSPDTFALVRAHTFEEGEKRSVSLLGTSSALRCLDTLPALSTPLSKSKWSVNQSPEAGRRMTTTTKDTELSSFKNTLDRLSKKQAATEKRFAEQFKGNEQRLQRGHTADSSEINNEQLRQQPPASPRRLHKMRRARSQSPNNTPRRSPQPPPIAAQSSAGSSEQINEQLRLQPPASPRRLHKMRRARSLSPENTPRRSPQPPPIAAQSFISRPPRRAGDPDIPLLRRVPHNKRQQPQHLEDPLCVTSRPCRVFKKEVQKIQRVICMTSRV